MKITTTKTLTGTWIEMTEPVTEQDFDILIREAEWSDYSKAYAGQATFIFNESARSEIEKVGSAHGRDFPLIRYTGVTSSRYTRHDADDLSSYRRWIPVEVRAALKGVRKEETKRERMDEARKAAMEKLNPESEWFKRQVTTLLAEVNAGIARFIEENNSSVVTAYQQNLSGYDHWVEYVDKRVDVMPEIGEIGAIEAQIAELQKKAEKAYAKLRDKRAKAWVEDWESSDWVWESNDGNHKMPDALIEATKEMVREGRAFNKLPAHKRRLW